MKPSTNTAALAAALLGVVMAADGPLYGLGRSPVASSPLVVYGPLRKERENLKKRESRKRSKARKAKKGSK
jgi:hypothetical protein